MHRTIAQQIRSVTVTAAASSARRRRRWGAVAVLTAAMVVPATSAQAALPPSGSWITEVGPSSGSSSSGGNVTWNASTGDVLLHVEAHGMPAGSCMTTYFDWTSPAYHHDLRGVRTCLNSSVARKGWTETVPVTGVRKLRVCSGPLNQMGSCDVHPLATRGLIADWSGSRGRTCAAWVLVSATGAVTINSGGDPRRCDA